MLKSILPHKFHSFINRINHYTPEGTKESHRSVHDLQSTTRLAESWMSQIIDMRMGFPCPFWSVVIDYFSRTPLFSINNLILMSFKLFKAQRHDAAANGNVTQIATLWRHRCYLAPPPWRLICLLPDIFGTVLSTMGELVMFIMVFTYFSVWKDNLAPPFADWGWQTPLTLLSLPPYCLLAPFLTKLQNESYIIRTG